MAAFVLHAVLMAGLFSRVPEIQRSLSLDDGQFGWVLAALPAGVLVALQGASRLTERFGTRGPLIATFGLAAFMPLLIAAAPGFVTLCAAMFLFGFITALMGVAMTVEADRLGYAQGRPLIAKSQGAWGAGFLVASGLAALAVRAGITPVQQYWIVLWAVLAGTGLILWPLQPGPPRPNGGTAALRRFVLPDRSTVRLMGFGASPIVLEMIVRNWSIIYLRDIFGAADWIAALSLPAFVITQTAGRFLSDGIASRIGDIALGKALAASTAIGIVLLWLSPNAAAGLVACAFVGLGISAGYPLVLSAVARRPGHASSESIARFMLLQNVIAGAAPVVFGIAAQRFSLPAAVILMLPLPVLSWLCARELVR